MSDDVLKQLVQTIHGRRSATADKSYTRQLLDGGPEKCARKFGEEAIETVLAGVNESGEALANEAADTIFHLLVLLESRDVAFDDVLAVLKARIGVSGLEEKARRSAAK